MKTPTLQQKFARYLLYFSILFGLYLSSFYSYLLFHTLAELFSILIGGAIFVLAWNFRKFFNDSFLLFIGTASLAYGFIDLIHTLSYGGMNVFPGYDSNLPTQMWIASRYLQSLSFLASPIFLGRRTRGGYLIGGFAVAVTLILLSIFRWNIFPDAYIEGSGLTSFKITSEYIIDAILAASILVMVRKREAFDRNVLFLLVLSIGLTMLAEFFFTFYIGVYDLSNLIGHLLKLSASYLIYKAIIETAATSIYTDVTQLRTLSSALRESERRERARVKELEALMDAVPAIVVISHDRESKSVTGNVAFYELLRVAPGALPEGDTAGEFTPSDFHIYVDGKEVDLDNTPIQISARDGIRYDDVELEFLYGGGHIFLYGNVSPLLDSEGNPDGSIGAFINISELKQAQAKLENYAQQLEISNQDLEQFAFVASHDLQEPLRKVISFGERLHTRLADQLEEDDLLFLERMVKASERMQTMIAGLLTYARVTTRANPFELVDLNEIARDVISDLEIRLETSGGRVLLSHLPTIEADPQQMRQLFQNLIANGLKFHKPESAPLVEVTAAVDVNKKLAMIEVKDSGVGFDPQYVDRIFRPFERLHGRSEFEGTGMGLAICKRIVDRHGGMITARPKPDQGTTFIIHLPVAQVQKELTEK